MFRLLRQPVLSRSLRMCQCQHRSGPMAAHDFDDVGIDMADPDMGIDDGKLIKVAGEDDYVDRTFKRGDRSRAFDCNVARLFRAIRSPRIRDGKQCFLLEGLRNIHDAMKMGYHPKAVAYSGQHGEEHFKSLNDKRVSHSKVSREDMCELCDTKTPQSLAAVFKTPIVTDRCSDVSNTVEKERKMYQMGHYNRWLQTIHRTRYEVVTPRMPFVLLCDAVRDPTNMGTLIRSAAAAGCQAVFSVNSCKAWNAKVVRSSACTVLQIPVLHITWHTAEELLASHRRVLLSSTSMDALHPEDMDDLPPDEKGEVQEFLLRLPKSTHTSTNWGEIETGGVLVVGNESRGLSLKALEFARTRDAAQVCIPINKGVNSLNVAMAGTVMLFNASEHYAKLGVSDSTKKK